MAYSLINLLNYFFNPLPGPTFNYYIQVIILSILVIFLAFIIKTEVKKRSTDKIFKKLFRNLPKKFLIISILILLYTFSRWGNIYLFSMRILIYILVLWLIGLIYKAVKNYKITYPELQNLQKNQTTVNKYLSKPIQKKKKHKKRK